MSRPQHPGSNAAGSKPWPKRTPRAVTRSRTRSGSKTQTGTCGRCLWSRATAPPCVRNRQPAALQRRRRQRTASFNRPPNADVAEEGRRRDDRNPTVTMNTVIFACIHNAGRSQMAAAWFNALADTSKARAISAGTDPGARVHPEVLTAMREVDIKLEAIAPQKLTDELAATATILVTMGCGEACPVVPGLRRMDWPLEDPKGKPVERVREIRDDVKSRVSALLEAEHWRSFFCVLFSDPLALKTGGHDGQFILRRSSK